MAKKKTMNFEEAFQRLEEITGQLEDGDVSLDKSLQLFEEGIKLSRWCHHTLEDARQKVEILLKDTDETTKEIPFEH